MAAVQGSYVKVAGAWKRLGVGDSNNYGLGTRVATVWKLTNALFVNVGGTWKKVYPGYDLDPINGGSYSVSDSAATVFIRMQLNFQALPTQADEGYARVVRSTSDTNVGIFQYPRDLHITSDSPVAYEIRWDNVTGDVINSGGFSGAPANVGAWARPAIFTYSAGYQRTTSGTLTGQIKATVRCNFTKQELATATFTLTCTKT